MQCIVKWTVAIVMLAAQNTIRATADHPNVLIVVTDDQGWGDLSLHGNSNLHTPNVDQLAREGARFDRFFVCPVCSPTRAEFLTGRWYPRTGVKGVSTGEERLDLDEQTVGEVFQQNGYRTGAFGKWHNGTQFPYHPNARGFQEYYGFCSGHWGNYWDPILDHNGEIVQGQGFIIDDLTDHAIRFMTEQDDRPFFCYVPYNTPHSPMQVPDRWWNRHANAELSLRHRDPERERVNHTRAALAMCENIDWNVGRLLQALDQHHLTDSTIVLYFSDNGPNGYRWNGAMKGRKGTVDEGGVRSPLFVRWPGKIPAGREVHQIAGAVDLLPTLTDLAGVFRSGDKPLDGRSLVPLLQRQNPAWRKRVLYSHWKNRGVSVRSQRYRLAADGQLFDLVNDPGQRTDIAAEQPEMTQRLQRKARHYRQTVLSEFVSEPEPFPVGHRSGTITQLPIRDAVGHGNIQRSARPPNSSYFTNWTATTDRITWSVFVHATADYEAELLYTCEEANAGTVIRLEAESADSVSSAQITAPAHPSHRIGIDQDRDQRKEGYEKNWGRVSLGKISFTQGPAELRLSAPEIVADQAIDVRLLLLRRMDPSIE